MLSKFFNKYVLINFFVMVNIFVSSPLHALEFQMAHQQDLPIIFSWLEEPHIQAFWDNSSEHREDIVKFVQGRVEPSTYANGQYVYWVASHLDVPFALIMTIKETPEEHCGSLKSMFISQEGSTYSIDYAIGNKDYLGKGLGAITLKAFCDFFVTRVDRNTIAFLIDPTLDNPRATRVYQKAGFHVVGQFVMEGNVSGALKTHYLMVKRIPQPSGLLARITRTLLNSF